MNDQAIIGVFRGMVQAHGCSADSILENPQLREEFLRNMRLQVDNLLEQTLLHALVTMRKRSKLPRSRDLLSEITH